MRREFRPTLWFKKGIEDAEVEADPAGEASASSTMLPVEDRYLDDGTVTSEDHRAYTLTTGATQPLQLVVREAGDVDVLVRDLVAGRKRFASAILVAVVVVAAVVGSLTIA